MNPVLIFTALGPVLGSIGWFFHFMWLFWVGVGICGVTLFLNLASGVMKLPVLPTIFVIVGAAALKPWYFGLGVGLLAWTALETIGEVVGLKREGRL